MNGTPTIDTARLPVLLTQLRLPTIARLWPALTETADRESWPAAKTLAALMEHEIAERARPAIALRRPLQRDPDWPDQGPTGNAAGIRGGPELRADVPAQAASLRT